MASLFSGAGRRTRSAARCGFLRQAQFARQRPARRGRPVPLRRPRADAEGHMVLTDRPAHYSYQGVTPIEGTCLHQLAATSYFQQSEQNSDCSEARCRQRIASRRSGDMARRRRHRAVRAGREGGVRERGEAALKGPEEREIWERRVSSNIAGR
ncbi:MAG: Hsp33 family molecular chaperone HslO [Parvularculaceae bacterium]